jgi:hypothetical protein
MRKRKKGGRPDYTGHHQLAERATMLMDVTVSVSPGARNGDQRRRP